MKSKIKTSPIENKILLLLGLEGLKKEKVNFLKLKKGNKIFSYLNWLPLKKTTIDYLNVHCNLDIKEISWMSSKGWKCYYVFASETC